MAKNTKSIKNNVTKAVTKKVISKKIKAFKKDMSERAEYLKKAFGIKPKKKKKTSVKSASKPTNTKSTPATKKTNNTKSVTKPTKSKKG